MFPKKHPVATTKRAKQLHSCDFQYLLIPEKHKDGAWHLHGFVKGLSENLYCKFNLTQKLPHAIRDKIKEGIAVYDFPLYSQKFGYCDMEEIRNPEAVSKYITKYVTKELSRSVTELNANMYYRSKGLKQAEVIKKGRFLDDIDYDFTNEYCSIKWVDYSDKSASELSNSVVRCF